MPYHSQQKKKGRCVCRAKLFPIVLHLILAELELVTGGRAIATFLPDSCFFCIYNQALFTRQVLPVFFPKMKSFASFQRQLNLYDSERVGGGIRDAYRQKLFVRDHPVMSCPAV